MRQIREIWTLIFPICKYFLIIRGEGIKKSNKIIESLCHSFDGEIILHMRCFKKPLNKIWC